MNTSWTHPISIHIPENMKQYIIDYWLESSVSEHTSIASFNKHSLELISLGAPSNLLIRCNQAAIDEIIHAVLCMSVVSSVSGKHLSDPVTNVANLLPSQPTPKEVMLSVIYDGCINETLAAYSAKVVAKCTKEPNIKKIIEKIDMEEMTHALLAFDTLDWIISKYPDLKELCINTFESYLNKPHNFDTKFDTIVSIEQYGVITKQIKEKAYNIATKKLILPRLHTIRNS